MTFSAFRKRQGERNLLSFYTFYLTDFQDWVGGDGDDVHRCEKTRADEGIFCLKCTAASVSPSPWGFCALARNGGNCMFTLLGQQHTRTDVIRHLGKVATVALLLFIYSQASQGWRQQQESPFQLNTAAAAADELFRFSFTSWSAVNKNRRMSNWWGGKRKRKKLI